MAKIKQPKVPSFVLTVFKQAGITIKNFKSAAAFEKVLMQFLKRNNVLHLSTTRNNVPRTTPLEYRLDGFTFYILSEGGGKFNNLKVSSTVSFSIAETYHPEKDFWELRDYRRGERQKYIAKRLITAVLKMHLKK